jgi:hypothetical protein
VELALGFQELTVLVMVVAELVAKEGVVKA